MFIECTIRRKLGSHPEIDGVTYHFIPTTTGEHVADVENEAHISRLLDGSGVFREYGRSYLEYPNAQPVVVQPVVQAPLVGTQVATPNIVDMDRDQLIAYADLIGMRKPHPAIGTDKLRANVAAFLELRASGDNDDPVDPDEDPKE